MITALVSRLRLCGSPNKEYLGDSNGKWTNYDQRAGMPIDEVIETGTLLAKMHASMWEAPVCDLKWLNCKDRGTWHLFDGWGVDLKADPVESYTAYVKAVIESKDENILRLIRTEAPQRIYQYLIRPDASDREKIWRGLYAILESRPRTIIHGDMRAANVFVKPSEVEGATGNLYKFIDWQGAGGGPPGIEMMQWLCFNCLEMEAGEYYKPCLEGYYAELKRHMAELQPEVDLATDYPYEFLLEDFAITNLMFWSVLGNDTFVDMSKVRMAVLCFAFCA
jgi:hypothetical protein